MLRLALKMLYGDVAKFVMLLGGLTFCALLMTQQSGVFCGLMLWTTSTLRNIKVPIWVCDAKVEQVNEVVPMRDIEVNRVRSVEGVDWAVPLYWGIIQARLRDGSFQPVQLTGLDSATMVGRPARMTAGNVEDLRLPNAVVVDQIAIKKFKMSHHLRFTHFDRGDHTTPDVKIRTSRPRHAMRKRKTPGERVARPAFR